MALCSVLDIRADKFIIGSPQQDLQYHHKLSCHFLSLFNSHITTCLLHITMISIKFEKGLPFAYEKGAY